MASRLLVAVLGVFWLTMSVLVWRTEYGNASFAGTPLNPNVVWRKILTSPDSSSLSIQLRGKRIGFCHLIASVDKQYDTPPSADLPEGLVRRIDGYNLDLSGTITFPEGNQNMRFDGGMLLEQNLDWVEFSLQLIARPLVVKLTSTRESGLVHVHIESPELSLDRTLRLNQLGQPETWLTELFGPAGSVLAEALPLVEPNIDSSIPPQALLWTARTDRIQIGRNTTQIYRLELRPMEGYQATILVSRAGEILKVQLPDKLTLVNEALTGL
jgi:hypothetical protein